MRNCDTVFLGIGADRRLHPPEQKDRNTGRRGLQVFKLSPMLPIKLFMVTRCPSESFLFLTGRVATSVERYERCRGEVVDSYQGVTGRELRL